MSESKPEDLPPGETPALPQTLRSALDSFLETVPARASDAVLDSDLDGLRDPSPGRDKESFSE